MFSNVVVKSFKLWCVLCAVCAYVSQVDSSPQLYDRSTCLCLIYTARTSKLNVLDLVIVMLFG